MTLGMNRVDLGGRTSPSAMAAAKPEVDIGGRKRPLPASPADTIANDIIYVIRSVGNVVEPNLGPNPVGSRTLVQFAQWRTPSAMNVDALYTGFNGVARRAGGPKRRRIAKPSEFADPLDRFGRRLGQLAANASIQPGPRRPSASAQSEAAGPEGDEVQSALTKTIEKLITDSLVPVDSDGATARSVFDETDESLLDVAVLSSEALDTEPLPEVDLSDLDTLVPLDKSETAAVVAFEPELSEPIAPEPVVIEEAALAPSPRGAPRSRHAGLRKAGSDRRCSITSPSAWPMPTPARSSTARRA